MIRPTVPVSVKTDGLQRLRNALKGAQHPALEAMFNQWVQRYSAWIRERFVSASRGDGTWQPLSAATIYARSRAAITRVYKLFKAGEITAAQRDKKLKIARRSQQRWVKQAYGKAIKGKKGLEGLPTAGVAILRDTGVLFNALTVGAVGNVNRRKGLVAEFGIGGPAQHPGARGATIGRIAAYHDQGGTIPGRPPQRQILWMPPSELIALMLQDAQRALKALST